MDSAMLLELTKNLESSQMRCKELATGDIFDHQWRFESLPALVDQLRAGKVSEESLGQIQTLESLFTTGMTLNDQLMPLGFETTICWKLLGHTAEICERRQQTLFANIVTILQPLAGNVDLLHRNLAKPDIGWRIMKFELALEDFFEKLLQRLGQGKMVDTGLLGNLGRELLENIRTTTNNLQ
ncbi:MAG: hypothetical protein Q9170_002914 [Blastenia crenularia]